jgi:aminopeptidase N
MKSNLQLLFFLSFVLQQPLWSQSNFTRKDSLQGGLPIERTCFDVLHYDLNVKIEVNQKAIEGSNTILFKTVENTSKIQLDLFQNMTIDSIVFQKERLNYTREYNAVLVNFKKELSKGSTNTICFYYSGNPVIAQNAPWDGGFVYTTDSSGKPWIGVACQSDGASLWYPCKDTQSDEPDMGATIKVTVPNGLTAVSNGRFNGAEDLKNGTTRWDWEVKNTINNYDINITIADFVHFHDTYRGLDLDYYVLRANEERARIQFEEVKPMLECFQSKFGPYPFGEDGYKLVETPYLGMEHQSAVAYGNHYLKGYAGRDLSRTGIGLLFDFIIIHESGHEWFGNSITSKDIADMWIHEGFTCYSESVYLECQYGYDKAQIYINGLKGNIKNDEPIIASYGVHKEGSADMYYKGALLLNSIRHILNNDSKWWKLLLNYSTTFRHQIIDTETVVRFFNLKTGIDLTPIFNQYLRHNSIPTLEVTQNKKGLFVKWKCEESGFIMPIEVTHNGITTRYEVTTKSTAFPLKISKTTLKKEINTQKFLFEIKMK